MGESCRIKDPGCFAWRQNKEAVRRIPNTSNNLPSLSFCCHTGFNGIPTVITAEWYRWMKSQRCSNVIFFFCSYYLNSVESAQLFVCFFFCVICIWFLCDHCGEMLWCSTYTPAMDETLFAAERQKVLLKQGGRPENQCCYVQSNYSILLITTWKGILDPEMSSDMNSINCYLCM